MPSGLNSALSYWDLSDEIPLEIHLAVPEGSHRPTIDYPRTRAHVFAARRSVSTTHASSWSAASNSGSATASGQLSTPFAFVIVLVRRSRTRRCVAICLRRVQSRRVSRSSRKHSVHGLRSRTRCGCSRNERATETRIELGTGVPRSASARSTRATTNRRAVRALRARAVSVPGVALATPGPAGARGRHAPRGLRGTSCDARRRSPRTCRRQRPRHDCESRAGRSRGRGRRWCRVRGRTAHGTSHPRGRPIRGRTDHRAGAYRPGAPVVPVPVEVEYPALTATAAHRHSTLRPLRDALVTLDRIGRQTGSASSTGLASRRPWPTATPRRSRSSRRSRIRSSAATCERVRGTQRVGHGDGAISGDGQAAGGRETLRNDDHQRKCFRRSSAPFVCTSGAFRGGCVALTQPARANALCV